jgi:hypothetical protein
MTTSGSAETQSQENARLEQDAKRLGIVGFVPSDRPEPAEPICWIWPENWEAFLLWCQVQTQWLWGTEYTPERHPYRVRTGLNYPAVIALAGLRRGRGAVAALMDDLRVIELELLTLLRGS